jgi:SAM-dependent methyltransferase
MSHIIHSLRRWLAGRRQPSDSAPPIGRVHFGHLRRVTPVSRAFGFERGQPVDRYYIDRFLGRYAGDIRGRVLEVGDPGYTHRFGGERVTHSDVLDLVADNPNATLVADLARADHVPSDAFDCIIFTQTLQFIYELRPAVRTLYRILKPGGVLLATFPVLSQICRYDMDRWGDYWRFTNASVRRLLEDAFGPENLTVQAYGNVLAAVSLLHGLAAGELESHELDYHDPDYQILISARAVKSSGTPVNPSPDRSTPGRACPG